MGAKNGHLRGENWRTATGWSNATCLAPTVGRYVTIWTSTSAFFGNGCDWKIYHLDCLIVSWIGHLWVISHRKWRFEPFETTINHGIWGEDFPQKNGRESRIWPGRASGDMKLCEAEARGTGAAEGIRKLWRDRGVGYFLFTRCVVSELMPLTLSGY